MHGLKWEYNSGLHLISGIETPVTKTKPPVFFNNNHDKIEFGSPSKQQLYMEELLYSHYSTLSSLKM